MSVESIDPKTIFALLTLHDALNGSGVPWAVMGSLSHALQGLKIQPNDIDITTNRQGAHTIQQLLETHVTRAVAHSEGDGVRSHLGELAISGVTVQVIGDMETRSPKGVWTSLPDEAPITVLVRGAAIPVHSLGWELEIYTRLNRMERVERLRELIARKKHTP